MEPQYISRVKKRTICTPERETPMQVEIHFSNGTSVFFPRSSTVGDVMYYCTYNKCTVTGVGK